MPAPVLLRGDHDAGALRRLARKAKDGNQTRRLLALAEIYEGGSRGDAAKIGGCRLFVTGCCGSMPKALTA
jgi:hypothetical protein